MASTTSATGSASGLRARRVAAGRVAFDQAIAPAARSGSSRLPRRRLPARRRARGRRAACPSESRSSMRIAFSARPARPSRSAGRARPACDCTARVSSTPSRISTQTRYTEKQGQEDQGEVSGDQVHRGEGVHVEAEEPAQHLEGDRDDAPGHRGRAPAHVGVGQEPVEQRQRAPTRGRSGRHARPRGSRAGPRRRPSSAAGEGRGRSRRTRSAIASSISE